MNIKFKILDLFLLTALVALLAAVFRIDRTFFRQLLWFLLVSAGSILSMLLNRHAPQRAILSAIGGWLAGLLFAIASFSFEPWLFDPINVSIPPWFVELPFSIGLAPIMGFAVGSLANIHLQGKEISSEFKRPVLFSWIMLGGLFLISLFAMFDRISTFGFVRDWSIVSAIVFTVFVLHTYQWHSNYERNQLGLDSNSNSDPDQPDEL